MRPEIVKMHDEVNDFLLFMYFIESISHNNIIVNKIKSLAVMMYRLLKKINMPNYFNNQVIKTLDNILNKTIVKIYLKT